MPLEHVVTYQAFCEITNFIRENGDDWGEFCHYTAHHSTTRKTINTPPPSNQKVSHHKNAKTKGTLAPELLLQANSHRFVLFLIQHNDIGSILCPWHQFLSQKRNDNTHYIKTLYSLENIFILSTIPPSHVFALKALRKWTTKACEAWGHRKVQWNYGGGDPVSLTQMH